MRFRAPFPASIGLVDHAIPDNLTAGPVGLSPVTPKPTSGSAPGGASGSVSGNTAGPHPGTVTWEISLHGQLAGTIGLQPLRPREAELEFTLFPGAPNPTALSHAIPLALDFGFTQLRLQRITWSGAVGDWASWKAVWQHGFQREGIRRGAPHSAAPATRHTVPTTRDLWTAALLPTDPREPATRWEGPDTTPGGTPLPAIPSPRDPEALVRQFHATYRMPLSTAAADVDIERIHMRMALIAEEFAELMGAVYGEDAEQAVLATVAAAVASDAGTRDTVEAADALADMIYVIYGMALESGIPLDAVLHEVQRSNLSKLGADGEPLYRADGKVLKGPGFFNPDIATVLQNTRLAPLDHPEM